MILLWQWRHGALDVAAHDTLDEAASAAYWDSMDNRAALDCIEIVEEQSGERRVLTPGDVWQLYEANRPPEPERSPRPIVAEIRVIHPNGERDARILHVDAQLASDEASRLRRALGGDRVKLVNR